MPPRPGHNRLAGPGYRQSAVDPRDPVRLVKGRALNPTPMRIWGCALSKPWLPFS